MDVYDKAVKYLTEEPGEIGKAWIEGYVFAGEYSHPCSVLFRSGYPSGMTGRCLTNLRQGKCYPRPSTKLQELENLITLDHRIPMNDGDIKPEDLPVFAEWHRRLDKELNREVPIWRGPDMEDAVTEPTTQG